MWGSNGLAIPGDGEADMDGVRRRRTTKQAYDASGEPSNTGRTAGIAAHGEVSENHVTPLDAFVNALGDYCAKLDIVRGCGPPSPIERAKAGRVGPGQGRRIGAEPTRLPSAIV